MYYAVADHSLKKETKGFIQVTKGISETLATPRDLPLPVTYLKSIGLLIVSIGFSKF